MQTHWLLLPGGGFREEEREGEGVCLLVGIRLIDAVLPKCSETAAIRKL